MKKKTLKKVKKNVMKATVICGAALMLCGGYKLKMENAELKATNIADNYERALSSDSNTVGHNVKVEKNLTGYTVKIENNRGDSETGEWEETRFKTIKVSAMN